MLRKRLPPILCILMCFLVVLTGCGSGEKNVKETGKPSGSTQASSEEKFGKKIKITSASLYISEGTNYANDEIMKKVDDKFNVEHELIPLPATQWMDKIRIWANAGDMPDVSFFDLNNNFSEYKSYAEQGLIKALPDDIEGKYPNLAKVLDKTGVADVLKKRLNGKLYTVPKIIYFNAPTQKVLSHVSLYYRKDWADKLGIKVDKLISQDDLYKIAKTFVDKDPGGNGAGKTIGIATDSEKAIPLFVEPYNYEVMNFHKVNGKYVWGPTEQSTLEGLKVWQKFYRDGLLHPDFFVHKKQDPVNLFIAGKAGLLMHDGSGANINQFFNDFKAQNPDLNPLDIIDTTAIKGPDGKWHSYERTNFWCSTVLNKDMDADKLDRVLSIMDYTCTDEGQNLINLGIEGKDWKKDGNDIAITRAKDDKGNFKVISDLYPSYKYWWTHVILPDDWGLRDPTIPAKIRNMAIDMFKEKEKNGNVSPVDYDLKFYSGPNYDKKGNLGLVQAELTGVVLKEGNLEANWKDWVKSKEQNVNAITNELNNALVK